jgi:hypothetical protein
MKCYLIEHLKNGTWTPIELRAEPLEDILGILCGSPDRRARRMRTAYEAHLYRRRFNLDTVIHPSLVASGTPIQWENS